jgi:ankyrin repeat protein
MRPFGLNDHSNKRMRPPEMDIALWAGDLPTVWKLVNAGEQIPGLSSDDSNLRIIIQNCADPRLIRRVLNTMTLQQINYRPPGRCTALEMASRKLNAPVIEMLLDARADIHLAGACQNTLLHQVTDFQHVALRPLNLKTKQQEINSIFQKSVLTAQVLIRGGAPVDCKNLIGKTPLQECIDEVPGYVNTDLITLLVSEGAEPVQRSAYPPLFCIKPAIEDGLQLRQKSIKKTLNLHLPNPISALVKEYVLS